MRISPTQRDVLIEHLDGTPVLFRRESLGDERAAMLRARSIRPLIETGLLEFRRSTDGKVITMITEKGRGALAAALAEWADALVRAGVDGFHPADPEAIRAIWDQPAPKP